MKLIAFTLTMPGVASWNGKWSGAGRPYHVVRRVRKGSAIDNLVDGHYRHNWGDGWIAAIHARVVDGQTARKLRRESAGFCGCEWMVDSIILNGRIE